MTHVTHLSYRTSGGGAARSAVRMHQSMLERGIDSALLALENDTAADGVFTTRPSRSPLRRLYRHWLRTIYSRRERAELRPDAACRVFTSDRSFRRAELIGDLRNPAVIHLHFVAEMFDEPTFLPAATRLAPVVWTMRDMRAITGGCHCDLGCGRFRDGCGYCPQLVNSGEDDLSRRIWQRRKRTLSTIERSRLTFVAPSDWLAGEFRESPLCNQFPLRVIPNGVDTEEFCPGDVAAARRRLDIDEDAFVILFNAFSLNTPLKGGELLLSSLDLLARRLESQEPKQSRRRVQLVAVGEGTIERDLGIPTRLLGYVDSDSVLAEAYRAADVFVIPSLQDNCPNTVLEAMASGVPVVGFNTSGIPDLVKPGKTGLLAQAYEPEDLAARIWELLSDDAARRSMGACCRQIAVERYDRRIEAEQYLGLYDELLAQGN